MIAFFISSQAYTCSVCRERDLDPLYSTRHSVCGEPVCHECVAMCPACGEYIDDDSMEIGGPPVRFRDALLEDEPAVREGPEVVKLSDWHHASCAAQHLLAAWSGDGFIDPDRETEAALEAIVRAQFGHKEAA